jgi:hypothetical protein
MEGRHFDRQLFCQEPQSTAPVYSSSLQLQSTAPVGPSLDRAHKAAHLGEAHVSRQAPHSLLMVREDGGVLQHHRQAPDAALQDALQVPVGASYMKS